MLPEIVDTFPELDRINSLVLKLACDEVVSSGNREVAALRIQSQLLKKDAKANFQESVQDLHRYGYINGIKAGGGHIPDFTVLVHGFDVYARVYLPEYDRMIQLVACHIASNGLKTTRRWDKNWLNRSSLSTMFLTCWLAKV